MIRTKYIFSLCAAPLLFAQLTIASAQTPPEPAAPASAPEQTSITVEPPAETQTNTPKESKAILASNHIPKLIIRWDCGDCEVNEKVSPLIEKNYAAKAAAKGYTVSDQETAEMVVIKYRQRPPGARVMFGFMAGKDILETRVTFRGKEFLAGDYMANAWQGMDSLCEAVAQLTLDQMLTKLQTTTGSAPAASKSATAAPNPAPQFPVNAARLWLKPEGVVHMDTDAVLNKTWVYPHPLDEAKFGNVELTFATNGVTTKTKLGTGLTTYEIRDDLLCVYFRSGTVCYFVMDENGERKVYFPSSGRKAKLTTT